MLFASAQDALSVKEALCEAAKRLYDKNMLASCDGNLSFRLEDGTILITPSGVHKAFLQPEQIALVDAEGNALFGKPSSEISMHLAVYNQQPLARAVVHAHPPHAIAWSVAFADKKELPTECIGEVILATGGIPIAPYATPGSKELARNLHPYIEQYRALILSRHGALCWGESLQEAFNGMERVEHSAQILYLAAQLGDLSPLPSQEIAHLKSLRKKLGPKLL